MDKRPDWFDEDMLWLLCLVLVAALLLPVVLS
jgi:hypothetical protein